MATKQGKGGWDEWELEIDVYSQLQIKQITNEEPIVWYRELYSMLCGDLCAKLMT